MTRWLVIPVRLTIWGAESDKHRRLVEARDWSPFLQLLEYTVEYAGGVYIGGK